MQLFSGNPQIVVFLILLCVGRLPAQSWNELKNDFTDSWDTSVHLGQAMLQPDGKDLRVLAIGSFFVFTAAMLDKPGRDLSQNNQNDFSDAIFKIDDYYGARKVMIFGPLTLYAAGFLSGHKDLKDTGLLTMQAVLYTGLITSAMKELAGRSRPYLDKGPFDFEPLALREENRSFWSGHSSVTFAASTVLAGRYDNLYWKILCYGASAWVAGARMYHDKHWLSDVTAGALVGYAIGRFVLHENETRSTQTTNVRKTIDMRRDGFVFRITIPIGKI